MEASNMRVGGRYSCGVFSESLNMCAVYVKSARKRSVASFGSARSYSGYKDSLYFGVFGISASRCVTPGGWMAQIGFGGSPASCVEGHTFVPSGRKYCGILANGFTYV